MMKKRMLFGVLVLWVLLGQFGSVHAQTTPLSPVKKELIAKVLNLQQPAIENMSRALAEQPAAQMMQQAAVVLQTRIAPEKREAVGKEIQADLKKYADEAVPLVRDRALKLAPSTIALCWKKNSRKTSSNNWWPLSNRPSTASSSNSGVTCRKCWSKNSLQKPVT